MVFTPRPFGHTFHVWQRSLALVQFFVVQASLASFRAVSSKPSVVRPTVIADETPTELLTSRERFVGWLHFLAFLIGLIMVSHAGAQVYEHWEPADANPVVYAVSSFSHYLWPRLLFGAAIGAVFLAIAMLFKQRPPRHNAE
ncbi:hypothetical protein [Rhodopirellula sp. SWK7]|uniref:hypothetical protein n=1 Tax=Rhodopirellula sp. SWK7 TaxID=595460 RepID=UPI0005C5208C|nr:hypothetical protein [Rhodopirellula sp. SWK7]